MDPKSSNHPPAQDPKFLQVPSGAPPGTPRGPRASTRRRRQSPVPIESNPNPPPLLAAYTPPSPGNMTYEEAIEYLRDNTGERVENPAAMADTPTSVVLYEPRGSVLKVSDGPKLQNNVSICFLISWLQIFTDNYIAKNHTGNSLIVRSVEFRVHDGQVYSRLPNLEGGLSYINSNGVVSASVSWPCNGTLMEKYWELLRAKIHIGDDGLMKYPIIKVRTVKYFADTCEGVPVPKPLGGGHVFVVRGQKLDIHRYFQLQGESVPKCITELDARLTVAARQHEQKIAAEKQAKDEAAMNQILRRRATREAGLNRRDAPASPKQPQDANAASHSCPAAAGGPTGDASGLAPVNLKGRTRDKETALLKNPTRGQPFKVVSIPMGNSTVDVVVPFRPPIHPDPAKNWGKYQRAGGSPQVHNAFPLDHVAFDLKDMPKTITPSPMSSNAVFKDGEYYMQSFKNNEKATSPSRAALEAPKAQTTQNASVKNGSGKAADSQFIAQEIEEYWKKHEAAIGFDEEDDDKFFPAQVMNIREDPKYAGNNNLTIPIHRHGHRPSQNEDAARGSQMQEYAGMPAPAHDGDFANASQAPSRAELPDKKFNSTMNVNAPEFINRPASMNQTANYEFKQSLATGYSNYPLSKVGFSSTMPCNPRPYVSLNLEQYAADGSSQEYGGGNPQTYGADVSQPYGAATHSHPYGAESSQEYGPGNSQQHSEATSQSYGAGNFHPYSGVLSQQYGGVMSQPYGACNSQPFTSALGQNYPAYSGPGQHHHGPSNPYQPIFPEDSTSSGDATYKPTPIGPPRPAVSSSKLPSPHTASKKFCDYQRGKKGSSGALPASADDFAPREANQTFGEPDQYEVKRENSFNETGNKATPNRGLNNVHGSKRNWRMPHSRGQ